MNDILGPPMYDHSPLQSVSNRFWGALSETQRNHHRKEERLEQKLAMLKGDFLLAREVGNGGCFLNISIYIHSFDTLFVFISYIGMGGQIQPIIA